jgi:hypothetical protein
MVACCYISLSVARRLENLVRSFLFLLKVSFLFLAKTMREVDIFYVSNKGVWLGVSKGVVRWPEAASLAGSHP